MTPFYKYLNEGLSICTDSSIPKSLKSNIANVTNYNKSCNFWATNMMREKVTSLTC